MVKVEELTIQDVSNATGLSLHTLRYYERAGLLPRVNRNDGGHRRYTTRDVDSLQFLTRLRATGMPIHQVRLYAELVREGEHTIVARQRLLEEHRAAIEARMADLTRNLQVLDYKIGLYRSGWTGAEAADPCLGELRRLMAVCGPERERNEERDQ